MNPHKYFLDQAYNQAVKAYNMNEVPVGCVIVKDNRIISMSHNLTNYYHSPVRHAELNAIRDLIYDECCDGKINCEFGVGKINCECCDGKIRCETNVGKMDGEFNVGKINCECCDGIVDGESENGENKSNDECKNAKFDILNLTDNNTIKDNSLHHNSQDKHNAPPQDTTYVSKQHNTNAPPQDTDNIPKQHNSHTTHFLTQNTPLTFYITCEPCVMCLGILSRLNCKVFYGCKNGIFGGTSVIKQEMDCIKQEMNFVKQEMEYVKQEIKCVKQEIKCIKQEIDCIKQEMDWLTFIEDKRCYEILQKFYQRENIYCPVELRKKK